MRGRGDRRGGQEPLSGFAMNLVLARLMQVVFSPFPSFVPRAGPQLSHGADLTRFRGDGEFLSIFQGEFFKGKIAIFEN